MLDIQLTQIKPYQQYTQIKWYKEYLKILDELKKELFINFINNQFIPAINIQTSQDLYLSYYVQYLFGLYRPLGAASSNIFYDTGDKYDSLTPNNNPIIYDDSEEYNGRISIREFTILLRFVLNYSNEIVNQPLLIEFLSEVCELEYNEIKIEFPNIETIKFVLPNTKKTSDFVKMTINYYDWLCLPFGVNIDFAIKQ